MEEIVCRKYEASDRRWVRDIAWQTAFFGECADVFFSGREILADFLTVYFTDYEPQSCFVALDKAGVVGYLIGAKDAGILEGVFIKRILPRLLVKSVIQGLFFKKKNLDFLCHCLLSFLRGDFPMTDLSRDYPATLHINIRPDFRGMGIGSRLICAYLDYLRDEKVNGVHLATMSEKSGRFFLSQGFELLHRYSRSYFRYILGRDITVYIYGRKLKI
jgi:GNAT superfamily N-acetyltransferase